MSKKWIAVFILTMILLVSTWFLYDYQSYEDRDRALLNPVLQQVTSDSSDLTGFLHREVTLFVGDPTTGGLSRKIREIDTQQDLIQEITQTINYLIYPDPGMPNEAIPEGTKLINAFMTQAGIAYLNLTRHLQDRHVGGLSAELTTVASLVNTLLFNFKDVQQIQILVEGAEIETLAGHVDCRKPFSRLLEIDSSPE